MKIYFMVMYQLNAIAGIFAIALGIFNMEYLAQMVGFALVNLLCVVACYYNIKKIDSGFKWF